MKRYQRTKAIIDNPIEAIADVIEMIEANHQIRVLEEPNQGLVMLKLRDAAQLEQFYIGEVLVTECKVMIGDSIGLGILRGTDHAKAKVLAIVDAVLAQELPERQTLLERLEVLSCDAATAMKQKNGKILETRVNFETLYEEVKA